MRARESMIKTDLFGPDPSRIMPIINPAGSDSAMFDNCLEFLHLTGRPLAQAMMMMIPEPWSGNESMPDEKRAFYEYHACLMEPWDGPAAMVFTDGTSVGAVLDRNGLRPARYYVTLDDTSSSLRRSAFSTYPRTGSRARSVSSPAACSSSTQKRAGSSTTRR
jgi:glutamate synthase (ferredoxin)